MPPDVQFDLSSQHLGEALRITVRPGEPGAPILYILDPAFLFDTAVGIATFLEAATRLTNAPYPRISIAGVGYTTDDPAKVLAARARDLTPTDGQANPPIGLAPHAFGGAARFLDALVDEVIPAVESRQVVDGTRRALAGISFGGLFTLFTLFHRTNAFAGYLVMSPSIWWDDGIAFDWEQDWASTRDDLPARLFLSVGANEQGVGGIWKNEGFPLAVLQQLVQVDRCERFVSQLRDRQFPNLHLESAVFEGEYHLTVAPAALTRGMLSLFEPDQPLLRAADPKGP